MPACLHSDIPGMLPRRGKVRDLYDFGDRLLIVATDRISAFDWIMPNGVPDKGRLLTGISVMWFETLGVPHHLISTDPSILPLPGGTDVASLAGRSMVVHKTDVIPVECVVRGFLAGSGWKEYRQASSVCGVSLPPGLREGDPLPEPIFTPTTKAAAGHDQPLSFSQVCDLIGSERASHIRAASIEIYRKGAAYAAERGIIIADTKFEFGLRNGQILLIDEVLTPDSSRFWPAAGAPPSGGSGPPPAGTSPRPSFDKQFVRDWLEQSGWDKNSPPPALPEEIIAGTRQRYLEAYHRLVGRPFAEA